MQVITALECAGDDTREMDVPMFFRKIVSEDEKSSTSRSRTIADSTGRFLSRMALFNGDFTIEEARALRDIMGYYQPSAEPKESGDGVSVKKEEEAEPTTITLNLNLAPGMMEDMGGPTESGEVTVQKMTDDSNPSEETLEDVLAELNGLVGMDQVKNEVQSLLNFIKICQMRTERGMNVPTVSYHLVFTGNPGTGKTTVARMVAKLYYLMGILPQGQLVETDRSGLVAGYLG